MDRSRAKSETGSSRCLRALGRSLAISLVLMISLAFPSHADEVRDVAAGSPTLSAAVAVSPGWRVPLGTAVALDASMSQHEIPEELVDEVRYTWDLGDGTTLVGERIAHHYAAPGTFSIELTMEVFEQSGRFHRATHVVEVTVELVEFPRLVTIIDLETGFAQSGEYAALLQIDDRFLLVGQEQGPEVFPSTRTTDGSPLSAELERLVFSGGVLTVGQLRLWNAILALELASDSWLAFVGFGANSTQETVSLTPFYPAVEHAGYELLGVIDRATSVSLGICYEAAPPMYVLGSLGSLFVSGTYEGSSRVTVGDDVLPATFAGRVITCSLGIGVRIGFVMLSLQALLPL
ncbi:PKD domain-containing protein [Candidatus Bipolaricaulota bacterium]